MNPDHFVLWLSRLVPGWTIYLSVGDDEWRIYAYSRARGAVGPDRLRFLIPEAANLMPDELNHAMRETAVSINKTSVPAQPCST